MPYIRSISDPKKLHLLSDELYEITKDTFPEYTTKRYEVGDRVRLIAGVDGCDNEPGYHFFKGFVTVCSIHAPFAEFLGVRRSHLKKVKET